MTKKVDRFDHWISAKDAARILSAKMGFPVNPEYISTLAKSKKQLVRTRPISGHLLYSKADIEACIIRKKARKHE